MPPPSLLIVEDESIVAMDLKVRLEGLGYVVCATVPTGEEALEQFQVHQPDLVLMDIALGKGIDGIEAYQAMKASRDLPVVFLSAYADPATLGRAKASGPYGYLVKPFDEQTLHATLQTALARHAQEKALQDRERHFRALLENAYDMITVVDAEGRVTYQSPSTQRILGRPNGESLGLPVADFIHPEDREKALRELAYVREHPRARPVARIRVRHADGSYRTLEAVALNAMDVPGIHGTVVNSRDISGRLEEEEHRRAMEEQILRAQKRESLEIMAGGIAHDFNNLLMGILGNASLALLELPQGSPAFQRIRSLEEAGQRAAELVGQMLAYSGRGHFEVRPLDLGALLEEMVPLLEGLVSKQALFTFSLPKGLPPVHGDPTQVRQVVAHLVTNASDALLERPGAIHLALRAFDAEPEAQFTTGPVPAPAGVLLEVTDTGTGIPPSHLSRVFEPFFSTKFSGRGMGLAAGLGIMQGHRGCIQISSVPGEGSTLRLLFPTDPPPRRTSPLPEFGPAGLRADRRILVVDDEETARAVARLTLERYGYAVEAVEGGPQALAYLKEHGPEVGLILLDLTMPGLSGLDVLQRIRELGLHQPVLLASGFTLKDLPEDPRGLGVSFIQKPYAARCLADKVAAILGA